jgi:hypothetical protein
MGCYSFTGFATGLLRIDTRSNATLKSDPLRGARIGLSRAWVGMGVSCRGAWH